MLKSISTFVLAALVAALAPGCGGGSSSTLSKQELVTKADSICRAQRVKVSRELGPDPTTPAAVTAYTPVLERLSAPFERQLRDLKPPESESKTWKTYLAARRQAIVLNKAGERA